MSSTTPPANDAGSGDNAHPPAALLTAPPRQRHTRRWLLWAGLAVVLCLLAWWLVKLLTKPPPPKPPPPIPVVAAVAQSGDVPVYLDGIGTVQAYNTVTVRPRVDGALDKIYFVEGQDVKAGQLLAQIDPRPFKAQLEQVVAAKARDQALLSNARVDLKRYQTLVAQDSIATQQLDTQAALVAQDAALVQNDQAQIDYAKVQLDYTTIRSPIDGRTGVRQVDAGNIVHAADTTGLVTVTQVEPISVLFTLPEDQFGQVMRQMRAGPLAATATLRDDSAAVGHGRLLLVNNQVDPTTGTIQLKATFPNKDHALWPGQFVDVRLLVETRHNAVTVPSAAVQRGPQGVFAFVVKPDNTVLMQSIKLSTANPGNGSVLIDAGIAAGQRVVTDGQLKLRPGAHVRLLQPAAGGAAPASASTSASTDTSTDASTDASSGTASNAAANAAASTAPAGAARAAPATPAQASARAASAASAAARVPAP